MRKLRRFFIRRPDHIVHGDNDEPYLFRWHVIPKNRFLNIYLHKFLHDDMDRALHDHPWASCSIILKGGYLEHLPGDVVKKRYPGMVIFRAAEQAHRVVLHKDPVGGIYGSPPYTRPRKAWTLFITGPWRRNWGFHCPKGWVKWQDFVDPQNHGKVGKGCSE